MCKCLSNISHHSLHTCTCLWLPVACFLLSSNQWEVSKSEYHQPVLSTMTFAVQSVPESGNISSPAPNLSHILYLFMPWVLAGWGLHSSVTLMLCNRGSLQVVSRNRAEIECDVQDAYQGSMPIEKRKGTDWTEENVRLRYTSEVRQSLGQTSADLLSRYGPSVCQRVTNVSWPHGGLVVLSKLGQLVTLALVLCWAPCLTESQAPKLRQTLKGLQEEAVR